MDLRNRAICATVQQAEEMDLAECQSTLGESIARREQELLKFGTPSENRLLAFRESSLFITAEVFHGHDSWGTSHIRLVHVGSHTNNNLGHGKFFALAQHVGSASNRSCYCATLTNGTAIWHLCVWQLAI